MLVSGASQRGTKDMQTLDQQQDKKEEPRVLEEVTLGPRQGVQLPLGMYESGVPQPSFEVEYDPSSDAPSGVTAALKRVDKGSEYWLVYFFQNFTDRTYHITIKERIA